MERILYLFIALILMLSAAGCSALLKNPDESEVNYEISEPTYSYKDRLIDGLENKDSDLIKSVFSKRALSVCKDLDDGIQYMFDLYDGSFEKIVYQNTSSTRHYDGPLLTVEAEPVYVIKTTSDKYYKLRYTVSKSNDPDRDTNGVYSIFFYECEADSKGAGGGPFVAGINYPGREGVEDAIDTIIYSFTRCDPQELKNSVAEDVLSSDNNSEKIEKYITGKGMLSYTGIGDAWADITDDKAEGYLMLDTRPRQCVYVNVRNGKIIALKITEMDEDKSIEDYDVTLSGTGVVLP